MDIELAITKLRMQSSLTTGEMTDIANCIERAVLAKAGEQLPVAIKGCGAWDGLECLGELPDGSALYAHPLPAQAIPEGLGIDENLKRLALDYVRCGIGANYGRESFEDRMKEIYYPFRKIIDLIPLSASPKP